MINELREACFDSTMQYRYSLKRVWDVPRWNALEGKITFIMLNGSTADDLRDDPTLRRCIKFAQDWRFASLEIVNLFGYRTTLPRELRKAKNPIGPENDAYILKAVSDAEMIILAWGTNGSFMNRDKIVIDLLKKNGYTELYSIGELAKKGHPKHPLYLKGDLKPKKIEF